MKGVECMTKHKNYLLLVLTVCLSLWTFASISWAADTKIEKVSIDITSVGDLTSGSSIGEVTADTKSKHFTIDDAYFTTSNEVWQSGETPEVCIELFAAKGYRFSYTTKSHFTLSGHGATFKKAKVIDGGESLKLYVTLKKISGKPLAVENVYWKKNEARWDKMSDASKYEVRLYRGNTIVATETTTKTSYNFTSEMNKKGRYSFRVRSISKYDVLGYWSEFSSDKDVDAEEARNNASSGSSNSSNSSENSMTPGGPNTSTPSTGNSNSNQGSWPSGSGWVKNEYGWWFLNADGSYPKNTWKQINNKYYFFDANGYMKTGWINTNNLWYYSLPDGSRTTGWQYINDKWYLLNNDGIMLTGWQLVNNKWYFMENSGAMLTGWQFINNRWYFLDNSGAMLTGWLDISNRRYCFSANGDMLFGWQRINNKWYFFDATGALVTNTVTPDGFRVDASGAMIQ